MTVERICPAYDLTEDEKLSTIRFRTEYLGERGQWFIAEEEGKLLAAAIALDSGEAESIRVEDAYLRKGIATSMLKDIFNYFKLRSYSTVRTITDSRNSVARALFKKVGFREVGLRADSRGGEERISVDLEARL